VVIAADGRSFEGYTGETAPENHAEEEALAKALAAGADLRGATIYSTMEPCAVRRSKPESCSDLIIRHGLGRVVFALREPDLFTGGGGAHRLANAGIEVLEMGDYASDVVRPNAHILQ
jgi:pyrimidine deaminase RibD-like protein